MKQKSNSNTKSESFWNKLASKYNKRAKDQTYTMLLEKSAKYLEPNSRVLDFACATGIYAFEFADKVKEIEAFDTSPGMISYAEKEAESLNHDNITFSCTTIFDERYKEETFDLIVAYNILLYFDDVEKVLNRMKDLLNPGGKILTSTACLKERRSVVSFFSTRIIWFIVKMGWLPKINFLKMDQLESLIESAGFRSVEKSVLMDSPATEYFIVAEKEFGF